MNVIHSEFLNDLGTDFVAIAPNGTVVGRAALKESLERAHANEGVTILNAAGLAADGQTIAEAATAKLDGPFAAIVAQGAVLVDDPVEQPTAEEPVLDPDGNAPVDAAPPTAEEQVAKMDPDGDGKIGGSPKGGNRKKSAASK